jgi:ketosteroid isomerase-like protein
MASDAERLATALDRFNRDGAEAVLELFTPDVVWIAPPEWPEQAIFEGHDGLRTLERIWRENFDDYWLELHDFEMVDDRAVARLTQHGAIRGSGQMIETRNSWLVSYTEDRHICHVSAYFSWEGAMEAARS